MQSRGHDLRFLTVEYRPDSLLFGSPSRYNASNWRPLVDYDVEVLVTGPPKEWLWMTLRGGQ